MTYLKKAWRNLLHKKELDDDLDNELQSCLDLLITDKLNAGISQEDAERQARIELEGREQTKEAVRDIRAGAFLEQVWADIRYAIRVLRRSPGFAAVTILSLALGIGVNSTAFSNMTWLVLHPFSFPDVNRIVTLWETTNKDASREAVAPANYLDWKQSTKSFLYLAAYRAQDLTMTGIGEPTRIQVQQVTSDFFQVLGTRPQSGRTFRSEESEPGRDNQAVVSYRFWQSRLGSAAESVGRTLVLGQRTYSIVGIMPEDFEYPVETDVWTPLALTPEALADRTTGSLMVIGLLQPGVPVARSASELRAVSRQLETLFPLTNRSRGVRLISMVDTANGYGVGSRFIAVLFAAALFVMLLACANAANMMLARASSRQKEIGIRTALGANNSRVIRQVLIEIALLGLLAAILGVAFGAWSLGPMKANIPPEAMRYVPGMKRMHMDLSTVLYSFGLSLVCGLLCSIPALLGLVGRSNVGRLLESLKESGRTSAANTSRSSLRKMIVVSESALALLLLVGAGLMVQTFRHMLTFDRGFDTTHLLSMQTALPPSRYRRENQMRSFYSQVTGGLQSVPGVASAAASSQIGFGVVQPEGQRAALPGDPEAQWFAVTPNYFKTMGIPLREGRPVLPSDSQDSAPVAVIGESVAHRYWTGTSAIGRRLRLGKSPRWVFVIGVCGDVTSDWFSGERQPAVYTSLIQSPQLSATLFARTAGEPLAISADARRQVYKADPNQPVFDVSSMEHQIFVQTSGLQAAARSMTTYAVIALLLAVAGIYSLSSYLMSQRTHEIGLRMALGADRSNILHLSLLESARSAGIGLAIGMGAALGLARLMSSALYGVVVLDWKIFLELSTLLAAFAFAAAYIPAQRASRVDPMIALRHD